LNVEFAIDTVTRQLEHHLQVFLKVDIAYRLAGTSNDFHKSSMNTLIFSSSIPDKDDVVKKAEKK
jgi:hypothetical protein